MKKILVISILVTLTLALILPVLGVVASNATGNTSMTPAKPALVITAPDTTMVGQNTKILITEKAGSLPVAGAGVWAVVFPDATSVSNADISASDSGIEILLGYTDDDGYLIYAFKHMGLFVLVAYKDGYVPGFDRIVVKPAINSLAIKAPASALAGEPVTILVYDRNTGGGVAQANVWAVNASLTPIIISSYISDTAALIAKYVQYLGQTDNSGQLTVPAATVWAVKIADVTTLDETSDLTTITEKHGIFLGLTDEQGYVNPKPSFHQEGKYWLIALKEGYRAGLSSITVSPLVAATPTLLPNTSTSTTTKSGINMTASNVLK